MNRRIQIALYVSIACSVLIICRGTLAIAKADDPIPSSASIRNLDFDVDERNVLSQATLCTPGAVRQYATALVEEYQQGFELDCFPPIFSEVSLDSQLAQEINEEIRKLLNNRNFEVIRADTELSVSIGDTSYSVKGFLEFSNLPDKTTSLFTPLMLKAAPSRTHLQALIEIEGEDRLYISEEIADLYVSQLQFKEQNSGAFEALNHFLSNLREIDRISPSALELANMSFPTDNSLVAELERASSDEISEFIEIQIRGLRGSYRDPDVLNIATGDQLINLGFHVPSDALVALVTAVTQEFPEQAGEMILIYYENKWRIYNPFI